MTDAARDALDALADAVSLWRITPAASKDVIDAATDALVAGLDSPSLGILAGEPATATTYELEALVDDTMRELGLAHVVDGDAERAALAAMLRRLTAGRIGPRELAAWAHARLGHGGHADAQPFVHLDDVYYVWADEGHDLGQLDRWTYDEAEAFLAGRPSPGHADGWLAGPLMVDPPPRPVRRTRLARLVRRLAPPRPPRRRS
ncbi:hypothetical protein [Jiangella alkaliphila]|uniref:Uncharacterized protein n=1 Tax=Jiangella alkaliphila TaxID=419479 RepID=A0A1H2KLQ8_9ACTN|nr:hypothetical protein [Jiangella alkaliphila]SDU69291.1 hypothetical protein SAMN04488563_3955 [Jiangella alkaliphila]